MQKWYKRQINWKMSTEKNKVGETGSRTGWSDFIGYFFRKPDASRPKNFNIKAMHTINKISMVMFLVGLIFLIFKLTTR